MKIKKLYIGMAAFLAAGAASFAATDINKKPIVIINEDFTQYFYQPHELQNEADLIAYVDTYANTSATHFFMNVNADKSNFKSKVMTAAWENIPAEDLKKPDIYGEHWRMSCKILNDANVDPYAVWTKRCKQIELRPWISIRTNDPHFWRAYRKDIDTANDFWMKNPDVRINPKADIHKRDNQPWGTYSLDWQHEKVRKYFLAYVDECLSRYDVDGVELDWLRSLPHFRPGEAAKNAHFITEFMADVKKLACKWEKTRKHSIHIAARVPALPDGSLENGLDAVEWANRGYVDMIVASCNWVGDFSMDANAWKSRITNKNVKIISGTEHGVSTDIGITRGPQTSELIDGWASQNYKNGADGLYFFNLIYLPHTLCRTLTADMSATGVANRPRRYLPGWHDTFGKAPKIFPATINVGDSVSVKIDTPSANAGDTVRVVIGLGKAENVKKAKFDVKLNGFSAKAHNNVKNTNSIREFEPKPDSQFATYMAKFGKLYAKGGIFDGEKPYFYGNSERTIAYTFAPRALKSGINRIEITQTNGSTQTLLWTEIEVLPAK